MLCYGLWYNSNTNVKQDPWGASVMRDSCLETLKCSAGKHKTARQRKMRIKKEEKWTTPKYKHTN